MSVCKYNATTDTLTKVAGNAEIKTITCTNAEFNAMDKSQIADGTYINITDDEVGIEIDDSTASTSKVYSSSKVQQEVDTLSTNLGDKSSASSVSGDNAFEKIDSLNTSLTTKLDTSKFNILGIIKAEMRVQNEKPGIWFWLSSSIVYLLQLDSATISLYISTNGGSSWTALWQK